jgi:hypothetical protein
MAAKVYLRWLKRDAESGMHNYGVFIVWSWSTILVGMLNIRFCRLLSSA